MLVQQNSVNLTHRTGQVPVYWTFWVIRQYLYKSKFLQVIFCYFSNTWAVKLISGIFLLDIFSFTGSWSLGSSSVFAGVIIAEEVDGVGERNQDTTIVNVQTLLVGGLFEQIPEICLFY